MATTSVIKADKIPVRLLPIANVSTFGVGRNAQGACMASVSILCKLSDGHILRTV